MTSDNQCASERSGERSEQDEVLAHDREEIDIYAHLGLSRDIPQKNIKKQYHIAYHPDKLSHLPAADLEKATIEFSVILKYYKVLLDAELRLYYDNTGRLSSDTELPQTADWNAYFKDLWQGVVSTVTIDEFKQAYQKSEEERNDVVELYLKRKGNVQEIMDSLMCSSFHDEKRVIQLIKEEIKKQKLDVFKQFSKDCEKREVEKRFKAGQAEEIEAGETVNDAAGEEALRLKLKKRAGDRMSSLTEGLEKKYGKTAAATFEEPSDDVFAAIQASLMKQRK